MRKRPMRRFRVYIAAAWKRKAEAYEIAVKLEKELGWYVTSSWHNPLSGEDESGTHEEHVQWGDRDIDEIDASDGLVVLTEPREEGTTGGHHFEAGYALGKGKRCVVIGPPSTVFYHCAQASDSRFDTVEAFIIKAEQEGMGCSHGL